jgi:hypothetical protein
VPDGTPRDRRRCSLPHWPLRREGRFERKNDENAPPPNVPGWPQRSRRRPLSGSRLPRPSASGSVAAECVALTEGADRLRPVGSFATGFGRAAAGDGAGNAGAGRLSGFRRFRRGPVAGVERPARLPLGLNLRLSRVSAGSVSTAMSAPTIFSTSMQHSFLSTTRSIAGSSYPGRITKRLENERTPSYPCNSSATVAVQAIPLHSQMNSGVTVINPEPGAARRRRSTSGPRGSWPTKPGRPRTQADEAPKAISWPAAEARTLRWSASASSRPRSYAGLAGASLDWLH